MAKLATRFNAQDHDTTQREFGEELPNGTYEMEVDSADVVPTKDGRGTILKASMTVIRPEDLAKRKLFTNYNLENPNAQAQEIGQKQFASLCRAMGVSEVEDTDELLFKAFTVKVALGKPSKDGQYPARAEIKKYFFPDEGNVPEPAIDEVQPAPQAANDNRQAAANDNRAAARPAAAAAAGGAKRPWK